MGVMLPAEDRHSVWKRTGSIFKIKVMNEFNEDGLRIGYWEVGTNEKKYYLKPGVPFLTELVWEYIGDGVGNFTLTV